MYLPDSHPSLLQTVASNQEDGRSPLERRKLAEAEHKPIAAAKKTISGIGTVSNALAMFFLK